MMVKKNCPFVRAVRSSYYRSFLDLPQVVSPAAKTITLQDYPKSFRGDEPGTHPCAHPNDYKVDRSPIVPYAFFYRNGSKRRIFLRTSLALGANKFTTATFLLDTGFCFDLIVSKTLKSMLSHRLMVSEFGGTYLELTMRDKQVAACVDDVPWSPPDVPSDPVNVLGLQTFFLLGIKFEQGRSSSFSYNEDDTVDGIITLHPDFKFI